MNIARVFPRRTKATPTDPLAFVGEPGFPELLPEIDEVHISVAFTQDIAMADYLFKLWEQLGVPVYCGGPAFGDPAGDFTPGWFLKPGYVITSRGCPNRCWFCRVWQVYEGVIELPITVGYNVLDDNILACSMPHFEAVCRMLSQQPEKALFTGGLEAARLTEHHAHELAKLKPDRMYFALDTEDDEEPLRAAGIQMREAGFTYHHLYAYVLIGYPQDTLSSAETRLRTAHECRFTPMAMLWQEDGPATLDWKRLQRQYARPAITRRILAEVA